MRVNQSKRFLTQWPTYKTIAITALIVFSLLWTIFDWSRFHELRDRAGQSAYLALGLVLTEALFVVGALIMLAFVSVEFSSKNRVHGWYKRVRYARKEVKTLAGEIAHSKLFGFGFWLNFAGAVGTSLLLIVAVFRYVPVAGWGLLVLLIVDLTATFGWRIPLHLHRRASIKSRQQ